MIKISFIKPYNLDATLDCGQAFRFFYDNKWVGILNIGIISIYKEKNYLILDGNFKSLYTLNRVKKYLSYYFNTQFDFNQFYNFILEKTPIDQKKLFKEILDYSAGLRILNQEPLETTVSYLFSTQSNIPTIRKRIHNLCQLFPENKIEFKEKNYYLFPSLKQLKTLTRDLIRQLKLGFRERYFIYLLEHLESYNFFLKLKNLSQEEQLKQLKSFLGIGDKVAKAILLFSFEQYDLIPVDVWIKRFFENYFDKDYKKFYNRYYPYGGILQEYIYRWIRENGS